MRYLIINVAAIYTIAAIIYILIYSNGHEKVVVDPGQNLPEKSENSEAKSDHKDPPVELNELPLTPDESTAKSNTEASSAESQSDEVTPNAAESGESSLESGSKDLTTVSKPNESTAASNLEAPSVESPSGKVGPGSERSEESSSGSGSKDLTTVSKYNESAESNSKVSSVESQSQKVRPGSEKSEESSSGPESKDLPREHEPKPPASPTSEEVAAIETPGKEDKESQRKAIEQLRRYFTKKSNLPKKYRGYANKYDTDGKIFKEIFMEKEVPQIGNIASFGIALLQKYATKSKLTKYLEIVEDLITRVDAALKKIKFVDQQTPWNQSWYDFSVLLTRMLAMYEFLGTNDKIKKICHQRICEITPNWNKSLGWEREGIELLWIVIPRLITNYIYNSDVYYNEIELDSFISVRDVVLGTLTTDVEGVSDGIHLDWSNTYHKVATYWPLAESGEFYASISRALRFPTGIEGVTMQIFNRILHPSMDFVPFGLFGRKPKITCTKTLSAHWPNYKREGDLNVHVFPIIGLGVFKSNKFAFWARVQRSNLAAYESDKTYYKFAVGWIQMRKLYLVDVDYKYDGRMSWAQLKHQPGVISFADSDNFDSLKPEQEEAQHFPDDVDSHIGHFDNENGRVLYWRNKYKFKLYGDTEIDEFGVCTDNGLVMRHEINNRSGKTLSFYTADNDIDDKMYVNIYPILPSDQKHLFPIKNNSRKAIFSQRVFDKNIHPQSVNRDPTGKHMMFKFGNDTYIIESVDDYHIVKKNSVPILAGSSKIFIKKSISYRHNSVLIKFNFDSATLMFKPVE